MRTLTPDEIRQLTAQGCSADNWANVYVADDFCAEWVWRVEMSGRVEMGRFRAEHELPGGLRVHSGLRDVRLHHVTIGDDCLVSRVSGYIAHYRLEPGVVIMGCGRIYTTGRSTFGNGTRIGVLDETGSRVVVITDRLSAQVAQLMADSKQGEPLHRALTAMSDAYADSQADTMGHIGRGAKIIGVDTMENVAVGTQATVEGAAMLRNGTVGSSAVAPTHVGHGVRMSDFIVGSGACIDGASSLTGCFVGQATHIGNGFTAGQSLFFSNCQMECGEACALFAGPFTVSHHKATLLIGAMASFANAGSATNQSNHLYKAGPVHFGYMRRGCKTGSGSHIVWPARIGAFTMITGRIDTHPNTERLPFSYLMGTVGEATIVPAANLFTLGTRRDAEKWPRRDGRPQGEPQRDIVDPGLLNPYTVGLIASAIDTLTALQAEATTERDYIAYSGVHIRRATIGKALRQYRMAVDLYIGSALAADDTRDDAGAGEWTDLSGLIAPTTEIDDLKRAIAAGELSTIDEVNNHIGHIALRRPAQEQAYVRSLIARLYGAPADTPLPDDLQTQIRAAHDQARLSADHLVDNDARKEQSLRRLME